MSSRIENAGAAHAALMAALHGLAIAPPWSAEAFSTLLGQPGVAGWIAMEDDEPAGLLLARAAGDEAEILTLAVLPRWRRRGIGFRLVGHLVDWATTARIARLFLEVAEENVGARALYERSGFSIVGRRNDYYAPGNDALLLARTLA